MRKIDFKTIFAPQNRGILLDLVVFAINLLLMQILTVLSQKLVYQAEQDVFAKLVIGLFFAGLFFLQPLGPLLKRWSFHQRFKFEDQLDCGLSTLLVHVVLPRDDDIDFRNGYDNPYRSIL